MASPTTDQEEYAQFFVDLITNNLSAVGLADVFYGDQQKIAKTPIACVEPGMKRREENGAPRRYMNLMNTHIIIYHGQVQSTSQNQKVTDGIAESLQDLIHADATLEGRCIDSVVRSVEPGYQTRGTSLFRASMLTVEARQQELLPSNF